MTTTIFPLVSTSAGMLEMLSRLIELSVGGEGTGTGECRRRGVKKEEDENEKSGEEEEDENEEKSRHEGERSRADGGGRGNEEEGGQGNLIFLSTRLPISPAYAAFSSKFFTRSQ